MSEAEDNTGRADKSQSENYQQIQSAGKNLIIKFKQFAKLFYSKV